MIFDNALDQTFDQAATATFVIFVQEGLTFGAMNGDRPNLALRHVGTLPKYHIRRKWVRFKAALYSTNESDA
jgi:hypothetical protein